MLKTLTTTISFKEKFIKNMDELKWQTAPTQIYPISVVSKYLTVPYPLIQSEHNTLIFLQSGDIKIQIDDTIRTINSPSIIFIPSGSFHSLQSIGKNLSGYILLVESKVFNAIFNAETILNLSLIQSVLSLNKDENVWVSNMCKLLYAEATREYPNRKVGQGLLQALLYRTLELSGSHKVLSRNQQIAIRFRELVNTYFKDEKNVTFYAGELAISTNYLNRCIQSLYHKSAKEMIIEIAILHSQIMIWETTRDISEICYELNFEDPSYFSRIFKKVTGKTPMEYRSFVMHDLS